jgi:REP-associated tyrosine transposase
MPRLQRITAAGFPQHVEQRGNNRQDCFFAPNDYRTYLYWLNRAARTYRVALHAYVLMPDHVHLLVTPAMEGGVSKMMQYLGRQYVQYINKTHGRRGTLWERRFYASIAETEAYLLTLYRYIDLNPVRNGLVQAAEHYPWSSAKDHLAAARNPMILEHPSYMRLGDSGEARAAAYQALLCEPVEQSTLLQIRAAARQGGVLGSDRFKDRIEMQLGRRVRAARRGRKPKPKRPAEQASIPAPRAQVRPLIFGLLSLVPAVSPGPARVRPYKKADPDTAS